MWGNSLGTLDWRADPQNLPKDLGKPWPGAGYAGFGGGDWGSAYTEREMWRKGERPRLERRVVEGDPGLAL